MRALAVCLGIVAASDVVAETRPVSPPIEAYGRLPVLTDVSLSPSGDRLALVRHEGDQNRVVIQDLTGKLLLFVDAHTEKVRNVHWVSDRFVFLHSTVTDNDPYDLSRQEFNVLRSVDVDKRKSFELLINDPRFIPAISNIVGLRVLGGKSFAYVSNIPREGVYLGSRIGSEHNLQFNRYFPDLWRVDMETQKIEKVAAGSNSISSWTLGVDGQVVATSWYQESADTWIALSGAKTLHKVTAPDGRVHLAGLGRTADTILVRDASGADDRLIEYKFSGVSELIGEPDRIRSPIHDPETGLLTGYTTTDGTYVLFDPTDQKGVSAAASPFKGLVRIWSRSKDSSRVIVRVSGGDQSDAFFLVNLKDHRADLIEDNYPDVPAQFRGEAKRVQYQASDGLALDGVLTLPPNRQAKGLPLVVLPHGGPIGVHDEVEFDWMAQAFASRGYAVFQPNFRGSSGHGADLMHKGFGEFGRKMLTDMSDGLQSLAKHGIVDPRRVCIVGSSYGGYAALAGVTVQQGLYRCAVSSSGPSDLGQMLHWEDERTGSQSQATRFWRRAMGVTTPGAPSIESISPSQLAARADAPILLIHGKDDSVVPIVQSEIMERALRSAGKPVEHLYLDKSDHWLSTEAGRVATLKAAVDFVVKHNPPD